MTDLTHPFSGEPSPTRREAVKKKTADYLMRAEQISSQHLRSNMGQGSTQTVVSGREMPVACMLSMLDYANYALCSCIHQSPQTTRDSTLALFQRENYRNTIYV